MIGSTAGWSLNNFRPKLSMKRDVALARLKFYEHRLRERGISALYLFGSTARDESSESSDLDLLFEYDEVSGFSLFD